MEKLWLAVVDIQSFYSIRMRWCIRWIMYGASVGSCSQCGQGESGIQSELSSLVPKPKPISWWTLVSYHFKTLDILQKRSLWVHTTFSYDKRSIKTAVGEACKVLHIFGTLAAFKSWKCFKIKVEFLFHINPEPYNDSAGKKSESLPAKTTLLLLWRRPWIVHETF